MQDSPAQSTNLQGRTLADGRFVIVNLLGSGGMADVYRAYDNETKQDVAVKMPKLHLLADVEFVRRFDREVKIMQGLSHPHIVPVLFAGKHEGHTFAVFPYLTGGSLGDRIKNGRKPVTNADLFWLTQIAMALDYLHGQGLLHRDVKPDNIMFDAAGKAYLSDFGIVRALAPEKGGKAVTQLTAANGTIGTPQYMALELLLAKTPYTGAIDQYALAVTVYQALTGDRPYNGTFEQIVFQQARTKPPPLAEARPDLPASACSAVHRALAKKAGARFTSCIEFAQAVVMSLVTPTARRVAQPAVGKMVSSGETVRAPSQHEAIPRRAAGISRRSAGSQTRPIAPSDYVTPSSGGLRRRLAKHWYFVGAAIAVFLAVTLLLISLLRPEKRDTHADKKKLIPPSQPAVNPNPQPNHPPTKDKDKVEAPVVEPNPKAQPPKTKKEPPVVEPKPIPKPPATKDKDKVEPPVVEPKPMPKPPPVAPKLEKYITNSIGMKFALVPKGAFWMSQNGMNAQKQVEINQDFYLGVHEVTQGQWQAVMRTNPSSFSRTGGFKDKVKNISDQDLAQFPVERVSWGDMHEFIKKLNNKEKNSRWFYRLPTEAEWEYACRGGATSKQDCSFGFYFDKPANDLSSEQANFNGRQPGGNGKKGPYLERTTKVGIYSPNRLGLYDMHGNVWEWTSTVEGSRWVCRGGSWNDGCYSAADREMIFPGDSNGTLGFRVLAVPTGKRPLSDAEKKAVTVLKKRLFSITVSDFLSGAALNECLKEKAKFTGKGILKNQPVITAKTLDHLNITHGPGNNGHLGMLRETGKINWPPGIDKIADGRTRKRIETASIELVRQAKTTGKVSNELLKDFAEQNKQLRETLEANINRIPTSQFIQTKRFLSEFDAATKAFSTPGLVQRHINFRKWIAGGKSAQELALYMIENGLKFAPASAGGYTSYEQTYRAMGDYVIDLHLAMMRAKSEK